MSRWVMLVAAVAAGSWVGCGTESSVNQDCIDACEAENECPGEKKEPCGDLCRAVPEDCEQEHTEYWGCAAANLDQACNAFKDCGAELIDMSVCVTAYCLFKPLSSDCSY